MWLLLTIAGLTNFSVAASMLLLGSEKLGERILILPTILIPLTK